MPLTAIADFAEKGKTDPLFKELARLVEETHGIWNEQAEKYLLAQFGVDIRGGRAMMSTGVAIISRYGTGSVGCLAANRMWRQK